MRRDNRLTLLLIAVLLNGGLAACTPEGSGNIRAEPFRPSIDSNHPRARLVYGSDAILGRIQLLNPRFRKVGQLTQAQASVRNDSEIRFTLEYKFDWEDAGGFTVVSNHTWHRFTITPGELRTFNSTGKTPEAENIVFTIRLPDDVFIEDYKQNSPEQ